MPRCQSTRNAERAEAILQRLRRSQRPCLRFDGRILACIDLADGEREWRNGRYGNGQLVWLCHRENIQRTEASHIDPRSELQCATFEIITGMANALSQALNDTVIRRLAGAQSYKRGLEYFSDGHVQSIENRRGTIHAVVRGNTNYRVTLAFEDRALDYACDCPMGIDGEFCKHCVAAALAWLSSEKLAQGQGAPPSLPEPALSKQPRVRLAKSGRGNTREITLKDAGKILEAEDKDALVRMLLDWAKDDDRLRERLILYAARRAGSDAGASAIRRAFENAVEPDHFVSYREATGWARGVDDAIDSIEQLLDDGQAAAVIELCESALQSLVRASQSVDDSDGHFGDLRDRLQDIHYKACREARPDPVELAGRLFQLELHSEFDAFYGAGARYAKILGSKGMKLYRELAEAEWKKVPARTAKPDRHDSGGHFHITHIMESLARASGDIDQLVAVMSRDLSSPYSYWKIADVYREARQHDNALLWAEKGLKAFPERSDSRLREFAADEYHSRRRHDEAMKLMWAEFSERPILETYKTLERHAKKAGAWAEWRQCALAEIRLRMAKAKQKAGGKPQPIWLQTDGDHSMLVEIFLYEGGTGEAWREAGAGGCSDSLWLRLAAAREKEHPEDAGPVYLKQAEAGIARVSDGRYEDSVSLLIRAAAPMKRIGRSAEFERTLAALLVKYKIRRNFIKLVERKRKLLYLA